MIICTKNGELKGSKMDGRSKPVNDYIIESTKEASNLIRFHEGEVGGLSQSYHWNLNKTKRRFGDRVLKRVV